MDAAAFHVSTWHTYGIAVMRIWAHRAPGRYLVCFFEIVQSRAILGHAPKRAGL